MTFGTEFRRAERGTKIHEGYEDVEAVGGSVRLEMDVSSVGVPGLGLGAGRGEEEGEVDQAESLGGVGIGWGFGEDGVD